MFGGKCKCGKLRPLSLGLALGVTCVLMMVIMSLAFITNMMPADTVAAMKTMMPDPMSGMHILWAFIKGLVFGVIFAFLYNCFACCFAMCCKTSDGCGCNTSKK